VKRCMGFVIYKGKKMPALYCPVTFWSPLFCYVSNLSGRYICLIKIVLYSFSLGIAEKK
jgi:hypothetical protein